MWSTYLGGSNEDTPIGISAHDGVVSVLGATNSVDFPLFKPNPVAPIPLNSHWLSKFEYDGQVLFSSYLVIKNLFFNFNRKNTIIQHNGYTAITGYILAGTPYPITQTPAPVLNDDEFSIFSIIYNDQNKEHYSTQYNNENIGRAIDVDFDGDMLCILSTQQGSSGFNTPGAHKDTAAPNINETHLYCVDVPKADVKFASYANLTNHSKLPSDVEIYNNEVLSLIHI